MTFEVVDEGLPVCRDYPPRTKRAGHSQERMKYRFHVSDEAIKHGTHLGFIGEIQRITIIRFATVAERLVDEAQCFPAKPVVAQLLSLLGTEARQLLAIFQLLGNLP